MAPFTAALQRRMRRVRIAGYLKSLFGELEPEALREIESKIQWVHLASGEELFHQGDEADGAYIVAVGRLRVVVTGRDGAEEAIDEPGPGEWIGEMALLNEKPRSATVEAVDEVTVMVLEKSDFQEALLQSPAVALQLLETLSVRIRNADEQISTLSDKAMRDPLTGLAPAE